MNVPVTCRVVEWPGIGCGTFFSSNRPMRGPTIAAPHKAAMPPVMCTMPEPAKSITPPLKGRSGPGYCADDDANAEIQPSPDQPQCTTTG